MRLTRSSARARTLTLGLVLALALSIAFATSGNAQEAIQSVVLHGFAATTYGRTDANNYLHGVKGGEYQNANFALNISATVNEFLRITVQTWMIEDQRGLDQELDFAFAEWRLGNEARVRVGKVKQPFGISAEVFDVGTLRPFSDLPQAVYGPVGLVSESYNGAGFTGSHALSAGWHLDYDAYGGAMIVNEYQVPEAFLRGDPTYAEAEHEYETKDMVGGRAVFEAPWPGLRFGASAYTGSEIGSRRSLVYGAQIEQLSERWSIRSEAVHKQARDRRVSGAYAELAYRFGEHWQAAVLVDDLKMTLVGVGASSAPSLLNHREAAVGLNYWFDPSLVLKLAGHRVDGNRLAGPAPEDLDATVASGNLRTRTNLLTLAAQFSF